MIFNETDSLIPIVSVCMVSYNQERFVREAIDSVLLQKVSFPFEIIVSDDCSQDNTLSILFEYQAKYSNVHILTGEENVGYPNNQRRSLEAARGKYIALCDCDDYWSDPYKLQKQVDYLETNPECVICFHNVLNIYENESTPRSLLNPLDFPTELTCMDVIKRKWFLATNSEVFRREYLSFPVWYDSVLHIDYVLNLLMSQYGTLHYMPDIMSVYRHTEISVSKQQGNGTYDYLLFHADTMKTILGKMIGELPQDYSSALNERIQFYNGEINTYRREIYYDTHLLPRLFRLKTYKRLVKKVLKKLIHE